MYYTHLSLGIHYNITGEYGQSLVFEKGAEKIKSILDSTATMAVEPYILKVPVEIWREIFGLVLGPSISNPRQPSLEAYKNELFTSSRPMFLRYKETERKRGNLRMVCRYWKDAADALDDQLVVVCPDGLIWPPFRDPRDSKRILFFCTTIDESYYCRPAVRRCPISAQRKRTTDWQPKEYAQGTDAYSAPVDPTDYIAPVMDVINCLLDIPDDKSVVPSETFPRTLHYQYHGKHPNALRGIWHPIFHHLTCLHLSTNFPFRWSYPPESLSLSQTCATSTSN